jgi:hypothetical protein
MLQTGIGFRRLRGAAQKWPEIYYAYVVRAAIGSLARSGQYRRNTSHEGHFWRVGASTITVSARAILANKNSDL